MSPLATLVLIAVPSALATLALEMRDGRMAPVPATLDGGIVICLGAAALRAGGVM